MFLLPALRNNATEEDVSGVDSSTSSVYYIIGVMFTYGGTVNIISSSFAHNTLAECGGVMCTLGGSFTIMSSTSTNNAATQWAGVMDTPNGLLTLGACAVRGNYSSRSVCLCLSVCLCSAVH